MGLMGKILGKSDSQIIKEEVRKEADRQAKLNMTIAEQYGALASCRDTFERVIAMDRLNALERREKRIGDAAQKSRIHDAAVGLLAVEELELELQGAGQAVDLAKAQKRMTSIIRQVHRLDSQSEITKKDYQAQLNVGFDDTNETEAFTERADMVDEQFVEYLIQGYTMEECMERKMHGSQTVATSAPSGMDFSSGNSAEDNAYVNEILRKNAEKR